MEAAAIRATVREMHDTPAEHTRKPRRWPTRVTFASVGIIAVSPLAPLNVVITPHAVDAFESPIINGDNTWALRQQARRHHGAGGVGTVCHRRGSWPESGSLEYGRALNETRNKRPHESPRGGRQPTPDPSGG